MNFLRTGVKNTIFVLSLLMISNAAQALECTTVPCVCSSTIGIGYVQGTDGVAPNFTFQLAVPHAGGGFSSYYRDNNIVDTAHVFGRTWYGPSTVSSGNINGLMMIENAKTNPAKAQPPIPGLGNLEVMLVRSGSLYHFWRDRKTLAWSSGTLVASGVSGQPGFTQSKNYHQNFEVVVPLVSGGLAHYWRDNTTPDMPWRGPNVFGQGRFFESVSLIESNFSVGRLEVIARSGSTLWHLWRDDNLAWTSGLEVRVDGPNGSTTPISATGVHAFLQGKAGTRGDFELVVPLQSGGLMHYSRGNDFKDPYYHWKAVGWVDPIQNNLYTSAGAILSSFGNLEVVGRRLVDGALVAFYSNGAGYDSWLPLANNTGTPNWAGTVFGAEPCSNFRTAGRWQDPFNAKSIGIHAALQPTGKVLFFGFGDNNDMGFSEIFDPDTGAGVEPFSDHMPHAFCSGHTHLSDGRLWVAGGHDEPGAPGGHVKDSHFFDPLFSLWTKPHDLQFSTGRWYPTLTRLESGAVLAVSGTKEVGRAANSSEVNRYIQILNKAGTTLSPESSTRMVPDPFSTTTPAADKNFLQLYPFVFQLPTGGVAIHSYRTSRFFNPETNVWTNQEIQTKSPYSRTYPGYGSAALLPLSPPNYTARIMLFGGGQNVSNEDQSQDWDINVPADKTVEILDLGQSPLEWKLKAPMNYPRVLTHAVLLPDGKVFVAGGSTFGSADHAAVPVMTPELYDPGNDTWTRMTPMRVPRLYHATALLLQDARVIVAGRDHAWNAFPYKWPERRVEIFSPPYLESGNPRPVIWWTNADSVGFDQSLTIRLNTSGGVTPSKVSRAVLIAPGSETHGFDMGQRAIYLDITSRDAINNNITVKAPPNGRVAPPGYYMLFLVSDLGVPSVAKFVQVGNR